MSKRPRGAGRWIRETGKRSRETDKKDYRMIIQQKWKKQMTKKEIKNSSLCYKIQLTEKLNDCVRK